ncbi:hypothetical protein AVEN_12611-1 [Araneus ventricosus]|uniref:Uncharacterized protein n=1 Tax=Araneus ventricosus TaxID=182803 RepID=A0A4Y2ACH2_ARAVE|nr:hypothetical protein AVEN_12611-1 [Araneus ventricosus]
MIYYLKRPPCKTIGNYINVSCWKLFEFERTEDTKKEGLKYAQGLLDIIVASNLCSPYILTDVMNGFYSKHKISPTENVKEIIDRPEGILKGLETISIANSCYLKQKHGRLVLYANLQVNSLNLVYKGRIKVASFYPMITISGHLSYVNFIVEFSADAGNGRLGALHKFMIESFDGLNIEVQGLWPFNLLIKALIEATTICYKSLMKRQIEHQVKRCINQELASFTFPICHKENLDSVSLSLDPDFSPKDFQMNHRNSDF